VDELRAMVAALPVSASSVVACPEAAVLRALRDELAAASGAGMVDVFPDKLFGGWTERAKAAAHVTFSDAVDGWARLLGYL
jgi:hypothetical protein